MKPDWKLRDLQPSQFYISAKKLRDVERWFDPKDLSAFPPIPVKVLDGVPVMTDGHTRAVAALRAGLDAVPLVWDEDELDWEMYRICVDACRSRQVFSPVDLLERIIPETEYVEKWDAWCDKMHAEVEKIRRAGGEEMLALWGYSDVDTAAPTAKFFFQNISAGNAVFWTVDRDGQLIGELYAFLNIREDPDFADGKTTAYLCAFRVKREYRGQGLGSKLMEAALADLKSMGFRRATIGVDEARNEAFYRRLGFVTDVKTCYLDPCARDEAMQPEPDDMGYLLLAKEL